MSRMTLDRADIANRPPDRRVVALVVSHPDDTWMMPDEPFINAGCQVIRADDLQDASEKCAYNAPDLMFLPLVLGGQTVMENLGQCQAMDAPPVIIVVASNDQINAAAEAMRAGAYDCLFRPFSKARLAKAISNAMTTLRDRAPATPSTHTAHPPPANSPSEAQVSSEQKGKKTSATANLLAVSPQMRNVIERARAVAPSDAAVFITGETGTGKTELARLIHASSPRARQPWHAIDCVTLTRKSFETDVLGPNGVVSKASGGTLYLNEICELTPDVQPMLLNLINRSNDPSSTASHRFIASTRHDPRETIRQGQLRADLFYRLHVAPISVPPLRDRNGDISYIARSKLAEFSESEGRHFQEINADALALLEAGHWPGNVRELLNVLWTAVLLHDGPHLSIEHLPEEIVHPVPGDVGLIENDGGDDPMPGMQALIGLTLAEIEQTVIEATIRAEGGSVPRAARVLDLSPSTIYRKREAWDRHPPGGDT